MALFNLPDTPPLKSWSGFILCLDQATRKTGFAIFNPDVEVELPHVKPALLDHGVLYARSDEMEERITEMLEQIDALIQAYHPRTLVMEETSRFTQRTHQSNVASVLILNAIQALAHKHRIELSMVHPLTLKKCVTGNGLSDKKAMKAVARSYFQTVIKDDNHADALCLGVFQLMKEGKL